MAKEEIGFKQGVPENPDRSWEKKTNGKTFIFTKSREKDNSKVFLYRCICLSDKDSKSMTGFHSERDLKPQEVEELPQFLNFIAGS